MVIAFTKAVTIRLTEIIKQESVDCFVVFPLLFLWIFNGLVLLKYFRQQYFSLLLFSLAAGCRCLVLDVVVSCRLLL